MRVILKRHMRERDIIHEAGRYFVLRQKGGFGVFQSGVTHATGIVCYHDATPERAISDVNMRAAREASIAERKAA